MPETLHALEENDAPDAHGGHLPPGAARRVPRTGREDLLMEVVILDDEEQVGRVGADAIAEHLARNPRTVLGMATGSSPLGVYRELAARVAAGELSLADCRAFLLDEYVGLPPGHPQSYRATIQREFVDQVDLDQANVHGPDVSAPDIRGACAAYERAIQDAGGVDVQLLGIGSDGHIAFNEPGSSLGSSVIPRTRRTPSRPGFVSAPSTMARVRAPTFNPEPGTSHSAPAAAKTSSVGNARSSTASNIPAMPVARSIARRAAARSAWSGRSVMNSCCSARTAIVMNASRSSNVAGTPRSATNATQSLLGHGFAVVPGVLRESDGSPDAA